MVIRKNFTNSEIYNMANNLLSAFQDIENLSLPVKVHFYFQKNMNGIVAMAQEVEGIRTSILNKYGTLNPKDQSYTFEEGVVETVNKDINDLLSLEQEVKIYMIPLEWVENIELTAKQVSAFSFMIEEEEG